MLTTLAVRLFVALALAYVGALALLFAFQGRLIYPAPQDLTPPAPGFDAVQLETSDELVLNAHWLPPQDGRPSAVFFHGNAGSLDGSTAATRTLAEQGYGVLLVSYRGYGGNPGKPSEAGLFKDGRAAMAFLAGRGVAPDRTIIIGNSIGSGPATQMAQEFDPAALILVSPFASLVEVASDALPIVPAAALLSDRYANIDKLPQLGMPILIQHGTADTVVPFSQGEKLSRAAAQTDFQSFAGAGHELAYLPEAQVEQARWLAGLAF